MKANVLNLDGKIIKEIELPDLFEEAYRPDLIKKAVISSQSRKYQPKGNSPYANRDNTAFYEGSRKYKSPMNTSINSGRARLPRLKNRRFLLAGKVAGVPQAVGGPRAHPPKKEKVLVKKINRQEKKKAILSALSATANLDLVFSRSSKVPQNIKLPIILNNDFENLKKTQDVYNVLEKIGILENVQNAKSSKTIRAGKGKARGRKYKKRKSILFVLGNSKNYKAFKNLEGVDVVSANQLSIEELAPGTHAGRLTVFTEDAIIKLKERFS
ncbi:MAG TPA: 50S ribosomal protein L4 [archaeon]|nr:50S ribosomal protein L4 [archaeon]HRT02362.1 50S ribosomal protein L4 [Candidatus Diapherotrites archaeon]